MVGGATMLDIAQSVIPHAKHTIAYGTSPRMAAWLQRHPTPPVPKG